MIRVTKKQCNIKKILRGIVNCESFFFYKRSCNFLENWIYFQQKMRNNNNIANEEKP